MLIRSDDEALFSRRCESEEHARYYANGMKQDKLKAGGIEESGRRVSDFRPGQRPSPAHTCPAGGVR